MPNTLKIVALTSLAMIAFAANSVIARLALESGEIGPWSYTTIRLVAGGVTLIVMAGMGESKRNGNWRSAISLLAYAGFFSIAYISLSAGVGALILFAAVQITMIGMGLVRGERLSFRQSAGAVAACIGLVYLLNPGIGAPPIIGAILMGFAGISWGIYSLLGQKSTNPVRDTSGNFARAALLAAGLAIPVLFLLPETNPSIFGIFLAVLSGAVTSGLGYVVWYRVLRDLSAIQAGISQLSVPAIAAAGGILILTEPLSWRFTIASTIILSGVALATFPRKNAVADPD